MSTWLSLRKKRARRSLSTAEGCSLPTHWPNTRSATIRSAALASDRPNRVAQLSARRIALIALEQWQGQMGRADAIISQLLAEAPVSVSDRGFALELFYGVIRNVSLLDFWIGCLRPS